jgi:hypothetical protein
MVLGVSGAPGWRGDEDGISDKNYSCLLIQTAWFQKNCLPGEARR